MVLNVDLSERVINHHLGYFRLPHAHSNNTFCERQTTGGLLTGCGNAINTSADTSWSPICCLLALERAENVPLFMRCVVALWLSDLGPGKT
jgi:hypothetical protein